MYEIIGGKGVPLKKLDSSSALVGEEGWGNKDSIIGIRCKQENGWFLQSCSPSKRGFSDALVIKVDAGEPIRTSIDSVYKSIWNACVTNDLYEVQDSIADSNGQLTVQCARNLNKKIR